MEMKVNGKIDQISCKFYSINYDYLCWKILSYNVTFCFQTLKGQQPTYSYTEGTELPTYSLKMCYAQIS